MLYIISRQDRPQGNLKNPTENQWKLAEMLVCILKQFDVATKDMSLDKACISQVLPFVYSMNNFLNFGCENASGIKTIVEELRTDFERRFSKFTENMELRIAMMLDPRYKLKFVDDKNPLNVMLVREEKNIQIKSFHPLTVTQIQVQCSLTQGQRVLLLKK